MITNWKLPNEKETLNIAIRNGNIVKMYEKRSRFPFVSVCAIQILYILFCSYAALSSFTSELLKTQHSQSATLNSSISLSLTILDITSTSYYSDCHSSLSLKIETINATYFSYLFITLCIYIYISICLLLQIRSGFFKLKKARRVWVWVRVRASWFLK